MDDMYSSQGNIDAITSGITDNCSALEDIDISVSRRSFTCENTGTAIM